LDRPSSSLSALLKTARSCSERTRSRQTRLRLAAYPHFLCPPHFLLTPIRFRHKLTAGRAINALVRRYGIFGIAVDRKHTLKWLFLNRTPGNRSSLPGWKEKPPFHALNRTTFISKML
jgi:hypothetical protein